MMMVSINGILTSHYNERNRNFASLRWVSFAFAKDPPFRYLTCLLQP